MIAPSPFSGGKGLIDVVPAVGRSSDSHPANVLAKLARAYLELPQNEGPPKSFLAQTQELLGQLSTLNQYDAILIDARAGLNESTAASILGLGADILLFGVDTPQTFASYRYLLAHLARFPETEMMIGSTVLEWCTPRLPQIRPVRLPSATTRMKYSLNYSIEISRCWMIKDSL